MPLLFARIPHFYIRTDQKALESIYNSKPLDEISDEISDIVVSTYRYNFTVQYIKGKDNELADYLSRNPLWCPESNEHGPWIVDDFKNKIKVEAHICATQTINKYEDRILEDPLLVEMRDSGAMDQ